MDKQQIAYYLSRIPDLEIRRDEELKRYSTYHIGGPADFLVIPQTRESMINLLKTLIIRGIPFLIAGKGSNVLYSDEGFRGVVVTLEKAAGQLEKKGDRQIYAGAGRALADLVLFAEEHAIGGFERLAGIPGTVGGALIMNAGAFDEEIGNRVSWVELMDEYGKLEIIYHDEIGFGYRKADALKGKVVLGTLVEGVPADRNQLKQIRDEILRKREAKQPLEYGSCGSVFKRPPGNYAGTLIEQAGCKGMRIGDAMVSEKHANFIINLGNARARDVYRLMKMVQQKVYEKFGVLLEPEVKLIGDFEETETGKVKKNHE